MPYLALATDYDGTLARDGIVDNRTHAALRRFRESGSKVILVTGRQLDDLLGLFPCVDVVDRIVAENGAVVFSPFERHLDIWGEVPSDAFIQALRVLTTAAYGDGVIEQIDLLMDSDVQHLPLKTARH